MKALVKYASGEGNVDIREVEEPRCGDNQVKLEIAYCGICGTDIHVLHDTFRNYPPVILGHEFSGTVVEVGRNVNHHAAIGERVTGLGATSVTCGQCEYCLSGYFIFCSNRRGMGHGVNGAFTRYVIMRPDQLYRIPENFALDEAAMSEPFAAVVQAVTEITNVRIGDCRSSSTVLTKRKTHETGRGCSLRSLRPSVVSRTLWSYAHCGKNSIAKHYQ